MSSDGVSVVYVLTIFMRLRLRDRIIHKESACQLHGAKMTQHGLVHKGLTSAGKAEHLYTKNFEDLIKKQPNLGYADVTLNFACKHLASWRGTLSLCVCKDLYGLRLGHISIMREHRDGVLT